MLCRRRARLASARLQLQRERRLGKLVPFASRLAPKTLLPTRIRFVKALYPRLLARVNLHFRESFSLDKPHPRELVELLRLAAPGWPKERLHIWRDLAPQGLDAVYLK